MGFCSNLSPAIIWFQFPLASSFSPIDESGFLLSQGEMVISQHFLSRMLCSDSLGPPDGAFGVKALEAKPGDGVEMCYKSSIT